MQVPQRHSLGLPDHEQLGHRVVHGVIDQRQAGRLDFGSRVEPRRAEKQPLILGEGQELAAQPDTRMPEFEQEGLIPAGSKRVRCEIALRALQGQALAERRADRKSGRDTLHR